VKKKYKNVEISFGEIKVKEEGKESCNLLEIK